MEQIKNHLVIPHKGNYQFPVLVFSYTKLTIGIKLILYVLLSFGHFETEIDLTAHEFIHECLRCERSIGLKDNHVDLKKHSDDLLLIHVEEQVMTFPNPKRVIQLYVLVVGYIFDSVILRYAIPMTDIPPVQHSVLFR